MDPAYTFSVPKKQMASGSFDILSHIMETYFSEPNEDNVSDDIMEALMQQRYPATCALRWTTRRITQLGPT